MLASLRQHLFVYVSEDVLRTSGDLKYWIDLALNYNKTIAAPLA